MKIYKFLMVGVCTFWSIMFGFKGQALMCAILATMGVLYALDVIELFKRGEKG